MGKLYQRTKKKNKPSHDGRSSSIIQFRNFFTFPKIEKKYQKKIKKKKTPKPKLNTPPPPPHQREKKDIVVRYVFIFRNAL